MSEVYHWFRGATVEALRDQLNAGPVDRIEVHQENGSMTFQVVYASDEAAVQPLGRPVPLNESFQCPPRCP